MNIEDFNRHLAKQLTIARSKENLTQNDVAKHIDVANNSTIGRYENGDREPSLYNLYQMMSLYNTDANFYFPLESKQDSHLIPVFSSVQDIKDIDRVKKATTMLSVPSNLKDCFGVIIDNDYMTPQIAKKDIIIFQKTTEITEDGVYIFKDKNKEITEIKNVVVNNNSYILYSNQAKYKPTVIQKKDIIPIGKAKELRHKY